MERGQTDPPVGRGMTRSVCVGALVAACVVSCGSPASTELDAISSSAIQDGTTDSTHTFAVGVVQLAAADQNMVAFCSGVLLAPNLVATARHCVAELASTTIDCTTSKFGALYPASQVFVTTDTTITMSSTFVGVTSIVVPTGTNQTSVCGNDIALMILQGSIELPQYVVPVISPPMTDPQYEDVVTAIGYGIDTPTDTQGDSAGIRREKENVALTCIPNDSTFTDCFSDPSAKAVLTAGEFVSGDSTCEGDSGSGAFEQGNFDNGKWVAFGVLSRGGVSQDGATCDQPIYTRFDAWGPLIVSAAQQAQKEAAPTAASYKLPTWAAGVGIDAGSQNTTASAGGSGAASGDDDGGATGVRASSSGGCSLAAPGGEARGPAGGVALLLGLGLAGVLRRRRPTTARARRRLMASAHRPPEPRTEPGRRK